MALDREIERMRKRLLQMTPAINPPSLRMNIHTQEEWDNKKPTSKSQWKIDLVIEDKPDEWRS